MLGWILGVITAGAVCKCVNLEYENNQLRRENNYLRLTFNNHLRLLADFDIVNRYAKKIGYKGGVDFFYYLSENHDYRFEHFARFLNKVRHVRNDVAHNGAVYNIDQGFLDKLRACVEICNLYERLPYGRILCFN